MNVTFIIGNGFDLNLGMKTGYLDFLQYCSDIDILPNNRILSIYRDDKNKNEWSYMEKKLGEITSEYHEKIKEEFRDQLFSDDPELFIRDKDELENELMKYLTSEQEKIQIVDENKTVKAMANTLSKVFDKANDVERKDLSSIIDKDSNIIYCNFITFNYTDVLDRIVDVCKKVVRLRLIKH